MKAGWLSPEDSPVEIDAGGLPAIRGRPDAPALRMTVEELIALEQDVLSKDATANPHLGDMA